MEIYKPAYIYGSTLPKPLTTLGRWEQPRRAAPALSRWRRDQIHISPERARAVRRAPACPEWSVASDAEGGSGERGGPSRTHLSSRPRHSVGHPHPWWTQKGRGRLGHRETTSPEHTARSAVNVPDRRCAPPRACGACGSGTSSDRGLSNSYAYGSVFSSLRTCVATVPIRTPSSAATA